MEELRRCWKVPYIVYFCNLFEHKLDLIDLRIDEFEEAIIDDCGPNRNIVVIHLIQKLLKPFVNRSIDLTNYEQFLLMVLKRYQLEQLFLQSKEHNQWRELSMLTKLDIIFNLCECRLQLADVEQKLTEYEANELRIEPLGVDSNGNKLWYFGDLRLYEEKSPLREKPSKSPKKPVTKASKQRTSATTRTRNKDQAKKGIDTDSDEAESISSSPTRPITTQIHSDSDNTTTRSRSTRQTRRSQPVAIETEPVNENATGRQRRSGRQKSQPVAKEPATVADVVGRRRSRRGRQQDEDVEGRVTHVDEIKCQVKAELADVVETVAAESERLKGLEAREAMDVDVEAGSEDMGALSGEVKVSVKAESPAGEKKTVPVVKDEEAAIPSTGIEGGARLEKESCEKSPQKAPVPLVEEKPAEKEEYLMELKFWMCVCLNLEDWTSIHNKYSASKKSADIEIATVLETNYLEEMPALFHKYEKDRIQRLLAMAPKRQSERLQRSHHQHSDPHAEQQQESNGLNSDMEANSREPSTEQEIAEERARREQIARDREERLKQRLLRRELNGDAYGNGFGSSCDEGSANQREANDFNKRNYYLMQKVMAKIMSCKYAWPFKNAVLEEDAPDYYSIIEFPIDLSEVQQRVNNKTYKSRQSFLDDLELIVTNCLTYNGDDSFYGKLALKFQGFFRRWFQIFYPREISTSLEEKNRQLMKLMTNRSSLFSQDTNAMDGDLTEDQINGVDGEMSSHFGHDPDSQDLSMSADGEGMVKRAKPRAKRKPNPDKDKYIAEPQYVTKQTSSGRLVKMKINTDYDYTSDQENDAKKKRKEDDGTSEGIQQKHRHNTGNNGDSFSSMSDANNNSSSEEEEDDDDDIDFLGKKKTHSANKSSKARAYKSSASGAGQQRRYKPRRTVKSLTEGLLPFDENDFTSYAETDELNDANSVASALSKRSRNSNFKHRSGTFFGQANNSLEAGTNSPPLSSDDSDIDLRKLNLSRFNNTTNLFRRLTNINDESLNTHNNDASPTDGPPKLTFDQYVKKLTGTYTAKTEAATNSNSQSSLTTALLNTGGRLSLKVAPAPSSTNLNGAKSTKLSIPVVNPAIKAALGKFESSPKTVAQLTVNKILNINASGSSHVSSSNGQANSQNQTLKLITVNSQTNMTSASQQLPAVTTIPSSLNKKIFIVNNSSTCGTTSTPASSSLSSKITTTTTTTVSQNSAPNQSSQNNSTTSSNSNLVKLINMNKLNGTMKPNQSGGSTQFSIKSNGLIASSNTPKPLIMINNLNHHSQANTKILGTNIQMGLNKFPVGTFSIKSSNLTASNVSKASKINLVNVNNSTNNVIATKALTGPNTTNGDSPDYPNVSTSAPPQSIAEPNPTVQPSAD